MPVVADLEGPDRARPARPRRACRCPAGRRARSGCRPRRPAWRSPGASSSEPGRRRGRWPSPPDAGRSTRLGSSTWSSPASIGPASPSSSPPQAAASERRARRRRRRRRQRRARVIGGSAGSGPPARPTRPARRPAVQMSPRARPRPAGGRRRVLVVQQPLVGPERPVEPHRVVEAGHLHAGPRASVPPWGEQRRVEQRHVRRVGEHAGVQHRVVGQRAVGPDPDPLARRQRLACGPAATSRRSGCRSAGAGRTSRRAARPTAPSGSGSRGATRAGGTSAGIGSWWSKPSSWTWNDADRLKIGRPCWMATTRRVVNDRPSRMRSTS